MKMHFVWSREIQRVIHETLSNKAQPLASNSDALVQLFGRLAEVSEHYSSFAARNYELSRQWVSINRSSVYRMLERNDRLWQGAGLLFDAFELQKVLAAPSGSIIIPVFGIGGYRFEVIKKTDTNYSEALARLGLMA